VKAPCEIDTPAKRFRLKPRKNPYWVGVSGGRGGLSLGFRRTVKGEGVWVAKIVIDGERVEERIGTPDGDKAVGGALSFTGATEAALAWDKLKAAAAQNRSESSEARKIPTVQLAVDNYAKLREARAGQTGSEGALKLHVLSDREFAALKLARLNAQAIEDCPSSLASQVTQCSTHCSSLIRIFLTRRGWQWNTSCSTCLMHAQLDFSNCKAYRCRTRPSV
jgi:hypothetical protein